jgi:putative nucleotidyltransferase with HDIG domain
MRMLPQVAVATSLVVLVPVALVWWLRAAGVVTSSWMCVLVAMALSIFVSGVASAFWKRRQGAERALFSELLLWGWLRRVRLERRIAHVVELLGAQSRDASATNHGELLRALASALDAQDPYTEGHSRRVARHAAMVARELGLSDDQVQRVGTAAAMHDVGKLRIPAALLTKPDVLTTDEFEIVKSHATEGAAMVAGLGDEELAKIVRHHHERFDGRGYPSGLRGEEIPLGARIVAVADTFDAITSIRAYRPAAQHKQALDLLLRGAGTQLDPAAVRAFLRYYAGRKGSVLWAALAVAPQRLFAWMHGNAGSSGNVAFGELAATVGSVVTVGLAAMGTAAAVAVKHHHSTPRNLIAQGPAAASVTPRSGRLPLPGSSSSIAQRRSAAPRRSVTALSGNRAVRAARGALGSPGSAAPSHVSRLAGGQAPSGTAPAGGSAGGAGSPPTPQAGHAGVPNSHHQRPGGGSGAASGGGSGTTPAGGSSATPAANPAPPASAPVASVPPSSGTTAAAPVAASGSPAATGAPVTGSSGPPAGGSSGTPAGGSSGTPSQQTGPATKDDCKGGGYTRYGYRNQGQCVAAVEARLSRAAGDPSRSGARYALKPNLGDRPRAAHHVVALST